MTATTDIALPHGITLRTRSAGRSGAPLLVFLHGFPEAAFVWDALLERFAGEGFRCVAPNLRGYAGSSAPREVEAYRAKHLVQDIAALIDAEGGRAAALIAHDWGGAVAWSLAAAQPQRVERLVIVNSPHPATFLRELQTSPAQQAASAYMNFLCRPDAEALLAANDYARLWPFFTSMGPAPWLDEATRERYREVWRAGLEGGCNYYRASPLRPPDARQQLVMAVQLPPAAVTVGVPTTVVWGERDSALPLALLEGLDAFVLDLVVHRVADASHWIVHEQPGFVGDRIAEALARPVR